jgi:hypothetical protein
MSYTEYLRRKAAAAPVIVDTRLRLDASSFTTRVKLAASADFAADGQKIGVITNVSDPDNGGNNHAINSYKKGSGGRVPDASIFTMFRGSQALANEALVPNNVRYVKNSNTAGSISGCAPVSEPTPYVPGGVLLTTFTTKFENITNSSPPAVVYNFATPFVNTLNTPNTGISVGSTVTVSGVSTVNIASFAANSGPSQTVTLVAGGQFGALKVGTSITTDATDFKNRGPYLVTALVPGTPNAFVWNNSDGPARTENKTGTFISSNNGTFTITAVTPTSFTVNNSGGTTDNTPSPTETATINVYSKGTFSSNMVPLTASQGARNAVACHQIAGEQHSTNATTHPGPSVFVDDTIVGIKNYNLPQNLTKYQIAPKCTSCGGNPAGKGIQCTSCVGAANHTPPADMPHNTRWGQRPAKAAPPVLVVPSPSDARKVGNFTPRHPPNLPKHHGNPNIGHIQYPKTPYEIPAGTPAHLKINDPMHYTGTM